MRDKIALKILAVSFVLVIAVPFVTLMLVPISGQAVPDRRESPSVTIEEASVTTDNEHVSGMPRDYDFWRPFVKDQQSSFRGQPGFRLPSMQRDLRTHNPKGMPEYEEMPKMPRSFGDIKELNENRTKKTQINEWIEEKVNNRDLHVTDYNPPGPEPYFSISGNYSEIWHESIDANWTSAYIVPDLDGDNNPDVIVFAGKYEPTTDIYTEKVIVKSGYDGTHLWEESVSASGGYNCGIDVMGFGSWWGGYYYGYPYQHKIDFDGDGLEDGIVEIYKYDSATNTRTEKVIAKKGSDGANFWEESVSASEGDSCGIWAFPAEDLDGNGVGDVMVEWRTYNSSTHTETEGVIAKRGYDGTHLWEESVSGYNCDIDVMGFGSWWGWYYGYPYQHKIDFDGDWLEDGIVEIYKYDSVTNTTTDKVIAKKGSDGTNFWEESISAIGRYNCNIWAYPAGDLDGDTKMDAYVSSYEYDSGSEQEVSNLKAKRGYDGTNLWEAQSNDDLWVAMPFYSWYYYPWYEGYENASLSYDLNGDGKNDSLIGIAMEMHAITAGYPLNVSIMTPPDSFSTVAGSELIVKATVLDEDTLLHNATVDGKLSSNSFELYDDGKSSHGDDAKDDGIYSAKLTVPKIQNAVLEINARYENKCGSASRTLNIDTSTTQPLKVEAEIIDDNPPTFTGDTVNVRAVVSLNGSIVNDAEVKSTIIYPNSYQKNITLQNKGDYYEADFDWLFQGGEFTFDVVAYPQENAIQGYDTEKLNVYHGYLSLTQEDTGTTFKKGEPVDFKVEVTCAGLTCPGEVTSAEVIMEILPDNEEIALVGNGDGTYHATYTFTTHGIRDISFSASAPFCIPTEISGNSIEIKEEDYELKKAVEKFADDNIETLNATKYDASNLSIAGDYFFDRIDKDATEGIASIVAGPLAYLTTDALFPSMDYTKWYEQVFDRGVAELANSLVELLFYELIVQCEQESTSPFTPTFFPTYLKNVNKFTGDINKAKEDTLSNFGVIPDERKNLFFEDLNKRNLANDRIKGIISEEVDFPYTVYKARLAEDTNWKKYFIGDMGDIGLAIVGIIYPPLGLGLAIGSAIWDCIDTVGNLNEDGKLVTIASVTFSDLFVKSKKISDNTVSGISQFKDEKLPQIPEIKILNFRDVSKGEYILGLWWDEKECYTSFTVKNEGETTANVWVVTSYYPHVLDGGRESLEPEESKTFRIDYADRPEDGSYVSCTVFSETDSGIYFVKHISRSFYPIHKLVLGDTSINREITADQFENVTVISHPIKATLARVNMTTYEVIITAKNPFAYPINAEITQNTSSWNISIPPRERKVLNYTIHPELGVETTIPPAYMEYFDFQHNVTVTFASDAINFTATGIEIDGDLPYEISDRVEVNLSITNLVNVTNGTFNLTLIGNETFEYNITANIENVSTLSVEFGPIDVSEGEYIGILTFGWDDDNLTVDARNMRKSSSITFFDTDSPANPYPSIMGNHTGTIKPNHTVIATKLYTYPCVGTGGHTEYAEIRNLTWNATAIWNGYAGDWHNISFDKTVILLAGETYNYTIHTGSYPQIHHTSALPTKNGWINCTGFIDANGKEYNNWIPAIRVW